MDMVTVAVLWIVSLMFILVTLKNIISRSIRKKRCSACTIGTVEEVHAKKRSNEGIKTYEYTPIIRYTVDGTDYRTRFTKAYTVNVYQIGQEVEIPYNPKNPEEVNKKGKSSKADVIILCIGVLIGLAGVVGLMMGNQ